MIFSILLLTSLAASANAGCGDYGTTASDFPINPFRALLDDAVINGNLFEDNDGNYPRLDIMTAALGFEGVNGIPVDSIDLATALEVGGVYQTFACNNGTVSMSPLTTNKTAQTGGFPVYYGDGFPIQTTYPILVSDMRRDWVEVKLNNGTTFNPSVATIVPSNDYNEKANIVLFDPYFRPHSRDSHIEIDNGLCTGECYYVTEVKIVGPMRFIGPDGSLESGEGLIGQVEYDPYDNIQAEGGNQVIRAKLNICDNTGDEANFFMRGPHNSCRNIYGDAADYRLRLFTQWGVFKAGRLPVYPTDYSRYFTLIAELNDGSELPLMESNVEYDIDGEPLTVLGLAETGSISSVSEYNECYDDDRDNIIDVVLNGSVTAVTKLKRVEHRPSDGTHEPFYDPGAKGVNETSYNATARYTTKSTDHKVDIYDGITGDERITNLGTKFGIKHLPVTIKIDGLDPSKIDANKTEACDVIGSDIIDFFSIIGKAKHCSFEGNVITVHLPVYSQCDEEVVIALYQLVNEMPLTDTDKQYNGTYTASPVETIEEEIPNWSFGPITCPDGVTNGWTNFTALNLALDGTNHLCNGFEYDEACEPTFTICPGSTYEDVVPLVIKQNGVTIECGNNGTGVAAGGCVLETSDDDEPIISVQDNDQFWAGSDKTATPVTGIIFVGMTFVNNGAKTSIEVKTSYDTGMPDAFATTFEGCTFEGSDSIEGSAIHVPSSNDKELRGGSVKVAKSIFIDNNLDTIIDYAHEGTLEISDTLFTGNDVEKNIIFHSKGDDNLYQNCFIENKGSGSVFSGIETYGYAADNYVEGNEMETCDGLSVETPYGPSRCIQMEGTSCTVASTTPAPIIVSTSAPTKTPTSGSPTPAPIFTQTSSPTLTPTVGSPTPDPTMDCKDNEVFDEKKGKCSKKKKKGKGTRRLGESRRLVA